MPFWPCDFESCNQQGVRTQGDCGFCDRHICRVHLPDHDCLQWTHGEDNDAYNEETAKAEKEEIDTLTKRINVATLEAICSGVRQRIPCKASVPNGNMGGMNFHMDITFEDGLVLVARFRRSNATSPPAKVRDLIIESEVATLRRLEGLGIAPKVYDFALESQSNPLGVSYILMEKLPGAPLRVSELTPLGKEKVIQQLVSVFVKLYKHPFPDFGALTGSGEVGPFAEEFLIDIEEEQLRTTGPMSSSEEYYNTAIRKIMTRIYDGEEYVDQPVNAYLIHRSLLDSVKKLVRPSQGNRKFYLKHVDDKGDHILVDDKFNIRGIIDWEWARTAPAEYAFISPKVLLPLEEFYKGKNELGADEILFASLLENCCPELAEHVRSGRLWHRFDFCCEPSTYESWDQIYCHFMAFMKGLVEAGHSIQEDCENMARKWLEEFEKMDANGFKEKDWKRMALRWFEEWRNMALEWYRDDIGLQSLLERESQMKHSQA